MIRELLFSWVGAKSCLYCNSAVADFAERTLCNACLGQIHLLDQPANLIHLDRQYFSEARSAAAYEGPLMELIHQWKFSKKQNVFHVLSDCLSKTRLPQKKYDWIVPVPLHPFRFLKRGFNPAKMLADVVCQRQNGQVRSLLRRRFGKHPQVGLEASARLQNIKGQFFLKPKYSCVAKGSACLLVDDVLTTGATVNECARVLRQAGAERVDVLTLARTL